MNASVCFRAHIGNGAGAVGYNFVSRCTCEGQYREPGNFLSFCIGNPQQEYCKYVFVPSKKCLGPCGKAQVTVRKPTFPSNPMQLAVLQSRQSCWRQYLFRNQCRSQPCNFRYVLCKSSCLFRSKGKTRCRSSPAKLGHNASNVRRCIQAIISFRRSASPTGKLKNFCHMRLMASKETSPWTMSRLVKSISRRSKNATLPWRGLRTAWTRIISHVFGSDVGTRLARFSEDA